MTAEPLPATFRVLVTGSRDWDDRHRLEGALKTVYQDSWSTPITLVSGHCPTGADALAEMFARAEGWDVENHPAQWSQYGKSAGYKRNAEMVALGADVCYAFIVHGSKGASHTADLARRAGIPTRVYRIE